MARERKAAAFHVGLPICIVALSATVAVRCGRSRDDGAIDVRRGAVVQAELSFNWSKLACPSCGVTSNVALAAFTTASRGTEIFNLFPGSFPGVELHRTKSNIERSFVQSAGDTIAKDVGGVAVASRSSSGATVDVFYRLADQTIATMSWSNSLFGSPTALPFQQFLAEAAAAGQTNREDVFSIGTDQNLWQAWRGTGAWNGWFNTGSPNGAPTGNLASLQPAAAYLPGSLLYVFAVATDGNIWTRNNDPINNWSNWTSAGGNNPIGIGSGVAVTFSGASRIDIFAVDANGTIKWQTLDTSTRTSTSPGALGTWVSILAPFSVKTTTINGVSRYVAPTAIARAAGAIDLFVRDANGDIQLMTIRPVPSLSGAGGTGGNGGGSGGTSGNGGAGGSLGDNKERAIAPSSCINLTGSFGENTAAATACNGIGYEFLFSHATELLRTQDQCFLSSSPNSCAVPSGGPAISACTPFETTLSFPGTFNAPGQPPITVYGGGSDNQMARLKDSTGTSLILLSHQQIRSNAAHDRTCSASPKTSGDLIYQSADCGNNWNSVGAIDMCNKIDPSGTHNCFRSGTCADEGAGGDRPEMVARGTDLFVVEALGGADSGWPAGKNVMLFKSTDHGASWNEWLHSDSGRISVPQFPVEIATTGDHVVLFAAQPATPTIWARSAVNTNSDPLPTAVASDLGTLDYGDGIQAALSIVQASHSDDGDYLRVVYPVLPNGKQVAKTGLVRVNSDESVTVLTDSFVTVAQNGTGAILFPTLIEAERVSDPIKGDERPPVVLFWVETTLTPPSTDTHCLHGPFGPSCDWGNVSVKAIVFRGASQSPTYTITTAPSNVWRANGDYVHGASRYASPNDRFFLHWYNENSSGARMPMARLIDVVR